MERSSSVVAQVDLSPPIFTVELNGGLSDVYSPIVPVRIVANDDLRGASDLTNLVISGDVNPLLIPSDAYFTESAEIWMPFSRSFDLMVNVPATSGEIGIDFVLYDRNWNNNSGSPIHKTLNVHVPSPPVVTVRPMPANGSTFDYWSNYTAQLKWSCSSAVTQYQVRNVSNANASITEGTLIGQVSGSWAANSTIETWVTTAANETYYNPIVTAELDILTVDSMASLTILKVFAETALGWTT